MKNIITCLRQQVNFVLPTLLVHLLLTCYFLHGITELIQINNTVILNVSLHTTFKFILLLFLHFYELLSIIFKPFTTLVFPVYAMSDFLH